MKNSKTTKTKDKNEEHFYRFATALIAVPKKELNREMAKHEHKKEKPSNPKRD